MFPIKAEKMLRIDSALYKVFKSHSIPIAIVQDPTSHSSKGSRKTKVSSRLLFSISDIVE